MWNIYVRTHNNMMQLEQLKQNKPYLVSYKGSTRPQIGQYWTKIVKSIEVFPRIYVVWPSFVFLQIVQRVKHGKLGLFFKLYFIYWTPILVNVEYTTKKRSIMSTFIIKSFRSRRICLESSTCQKSKSSITTRVGVVLIRI